MSLEKLDDVIHNIDGIDERFAMLLKKYVYTYINFSTNKELVSNNLINQINSNIKHISVEQLDGISGHADAKSKTIKINSDLDDYLIDNTFMHEITHLISLNEIIEDNITYQLNYGLKVGLDDQMDFSAGFRLRNWEVDGNNYVYNKGNVVLDEWITEWLANKTSGLTNTELKEDTNGFFRKKISHGYDGSNVMNLIELVYGSENIANLITGLDLNLEERKSVIPIKEIHKINELIDSNSILLQDEVDIIRNLQPPYMKTPNVTGLIMYYISEYQKQRELENQNVYLQKIMNVLTRTYYVRFNKEIKGCSSPEDLNKVYNELSTIQNSMIWNEDINALESLESYRLFNQMRKEFTKKTSELNINNPEFNNLYLTPIQMKEKFKMEEEYIKKHLNKSEDTIRRI